MAAIQERNSDHQLTEPWFDAIRCHAERIVQEGRLPVTTDGLYNAVGLTEISQRANHQAERIAIVMTAIGFVQNRKAIGNGNKQRGWWSSAPPAMIAAALDFAEHLLSWNALAPMPNDKKQTPPRFCGCSCWASDHRHQHAAEGHHPSVTAL